MSAHELPPGEPPYDHEYDRAPGRLPVADKRAEQALLACLLTALVPLEQLATLDVRPEDFYWPTHQTIWDTWHHLTELNGTPADAILVDSHLRATKQTDAAGLVPELLATTANTPLVEHYARLIRDNARLRAVQDLSTGLAQLAQKHHVNDLESYLGEALQRLDETVLRFGNTTPAASHTGLADLSWVATTGQAPRQPAPVYVRRSDGTALFYAGQVNGIFGDPEHGKTWAAQLAAVQALNEGGTAAMIDVDHNGPDATAARMLLLGARIEHLADPERFRYYEPHEGAELLNAITDITARASNVVIIDSLGEIFPMLGVKTNDGDEITTAMRQVCTRPALAGSCVITIDHLPKGADARATGFAIGSIAKKRMIRGAYIRADARQKPTPGGVGRITLRIEKDTMGELRRSSGGGYAGTLILDSTNDYGLEWAIRRDTMPTNEDGTRRPTTVMELVAKYIEDNPGCVQRDILRDVPGKDRTITDALRVLATEGHVRRDAGKNRSFHHYSEIPYREAEDDHANPSD